MSHNEPIAWAVMLQGGNRIYDVYATEEEAKAIDAAVVGNHGVVPLYRSPTLADAEREAISRVYDLLCDRARELQSATRLDEARWLIHCANTLQGLWGRSGTAAISGAGKSAQAANTPPALTDEEREALRCAVCDYNSMARMMHKPTHGEIGAALARLFERLK
jgi:hypothetical protein